VSDAPGAIETPDGVHLGTHRGLAFYTFGQREGLSVGGRRGYPQAPWFVAAKDTARNVLVVVQGHDHPLLSSDAVTTGAVHWLSQTPSVAIRAQVKVRYRQADQWCRVEPLNDGTARIAFDEPQRAVTPGQYAVLYDADRCLGGAAINTVVSRGRLSEAA
jgi:tRNA-specific 2-thiouridylase